MVKQCLARYGRSLFIVLVLVTLGGGEAQAINFNLLGVSGCEGGGPATFSGTASFMVNDDCSGRADFNITLDPDQTLTGAVLYPQAPDVSCMGSGAIGPLTGDCNIMNGCGINLTYGQYLSLASGNTSVEVTWSGGSAWAMVVPIAIKDPPDCRPRSAVPAVSAWGQVIIFALIAGGAVLLLWRMGSA